MDRDFVKRIGLDKLKPNGSRKGDLMQTSCGSPCYAAPNLSSATLYIPAARSMCGAVVSYW